MSESPLFAQAGETPQVTEQPEEQPSRFGGLRVNSKAKSKRGNRKFFDSADWAMKAQQGEPQGGGEHNFGPFTPPPTTEEATGSCLLVSEENPSPLAG